MNWDKKTYAQLFGGRYDGKIIGPPMACMDHYRVPIDLQLPPDGRLVRVGHAIYRVSRLVKTSKGKMARYEFEKDVYFEHWNAHYKHR